VDVHHEVRPVGSKEAVEGPRLGILEEEVVAVEVVPERVAASVASRAVRVEGRDRGDPYVRVNLGGPGPCRASSPPATDRLASSRLVAVLAADRRDP
jgi:hypothetical protein